MAKDKITTQPHALNDTVFFENIAQVIEQARKFVGRTADLTMTITYLTIGQMIVEKEQDGKNRAEYGKAVIMELAKFLSAKYKKGFSETNLRNAVKFYSIYGEHIKDKMTIPQSLTAKLSKSTNSQKPQSLTAEFTPLNMWRQVFPLSWTHYTILMRIENTDERKFYEIESFNENWSVDKLKKEYHGSLYERLALSRNKDKIMELSRKGQIVEQPKDILKDPLVLEFLGMAENTDYNESDLEQAILSKMQNFLLELGKGFLFEARQKRFSFDEKHFFVDLVFYNRLLKCYVLIDLKTEELKHQDLGQMQMYVNYFDRFVRAKDEKPTIGILLCKKKSNNIVELTLPTDSNIYASEYSLYLPDKNLLQKKLAEWIQEFENNKETI
jgi:predicted nuclease of restriction endonuclease-like (RecB) superfamily